MRGHRDVGKRQRRAEWRKKNARRSCGRERRADLKREAFVTRFDGEAPTRGSFELDERGVALVSADGRRIAVGAEVRFRVDRYDEASQRWRFVPEAIR